MQFVHPALTWGFLLLLVPVLIHLINMMRRRRVQWAAMQFLLESQKRNQRSVWFKQLLLLLSRMAAIGLLVAIMAGLTTSDQWSTLFGGGGTHHYVILDDSMSMSDRTGGVEVMDRGREVIKQIAAVAAEKRTPQRLTLLRTSRAAAGDGGVARVDISGDDVDSTFRDSLEESLRVVDSTELAIGPAGAIAAVNRFITDNVESENSLVYLVGDFRRRDWSQSQDVKQRLQELSNKAAEIHLVNCSRRNPINLGITRLAPESATLAAGVPTFLEVTVRNYSETPATGVQVKLSTYHDDDTDRKFASAGEGLGAPHSEPTVYFEEVPPGEEVTRRAQIYFPTAGQHVAVAELPDDAVAADNRRFQILNAPPAIPVLLVDGDVQQRNAYFMTAVFQPGEAVNTGIQPLVVGPQYLRDASLETLQSFDAIYLFDVARFDGDAVKKLKDYAASGRGVAVFAGPGSTVDALNSLHEGGLLPAKVIGTKELAPPIAGEETVDFVPSEHPIFSVFRGEKNRFRNDLKFYQYYDLDATWKPEEQGAILGKLRDGRPLIVEQQVGDGSVVTFLTSLTPDWNNWSITPGFIVTALELQAYLASGTRKSAERLVGGPIRVEVDAANFRNDALVFAPGADRMPTVKRDRATLTKQDGGALLELDYVGVNNVTGDSLTGLSGVYDVWLTQSDGHPNLRRFALNVDPLEGDLTTTDRNELQAALAPVTFTYHTVESVDYSWSASEGFAWQDYLLYALLGLLVVEQLLAYLTSYHPPAMGGAR
ncbi:BatA domain-containing protein [Blastopirellula sp. JC732]|uniref:BatA domain-containing protein n=1 Tax=Blastopirellula sediminis TaxID=2894196 RepID=A0A9X1MV95_9BACT|nr:BatA domain-containing protein [Blastopirellula sediminis]MCC9604447.1 BatA domain-containing protein [Blastopirellula sediminis]MCC9632254.1 BatA domain-containing protein [Blastopirellula sediminis]